MDVNAVDKKYKDYIERLVDGIIPLLPKDVNKLQQDYLVSNIKHSCMLLASSMQTDSVFGSLSDDKQQVYMQIMAEWSFHKEIDLFRSGIPAKYWKTVMQKIWYTIWEVMFACIQNDTSDEVLMTVIERYVNRTYKDAVEELKDTNIIDQQTEERAKEQSNIEIMAQEYREKLKRRKIKRILYYILIFILVVFVVSGSVYYFKMYGVIGILTAMVIYNIFPHIKK